MGYALPQFNILVNFWVHGTFPNTSGPSSVDIPASMYLFSRSSNEVMDSVIQFHYPSVWFRFAVADWGVLPHSKIDGIIGYTDVTGFDGYYQVLWWNVIHAGFANEYIMVQTFQVDDAGSAPDTRR